MPGDQRENAEVVELQARATSLLRAAHGRADSLRTAILSYLQEGYRLGLGPSELTDYFCVSTPNIVEAAGYADAAGDEVVALFDELHEQFRRNVR
jgi:hypothetical protein